MVSLALNDDWPNADTGHQYALDIINAKIPACNYLRLACDRYFNDLETAENRGFRLNVDAADRVIRFFKLTRHIKGELAGLPVRPEPWLCFALLNTYGWQHIDTGYRRFRQAYISVARKNGKSTSMAGLGLYGLVGDGEQGAEIYSAATSRAQAKIVFDTAKEMVKRSPELKRRINVLNNNLNVEKTASFFVPLSSDHDSLEGQNTHTAIIDELHAHKRREVYEVIENSTGARTQPLILVITTAGTNKMGVCYELHKYCIRVLEGSVTDDSIFPLIYTIDEEDLQNWNDPKIWIKANPNLGVSVQMDDLQRICRKAEQVPTMQLTFKAKRCNFWLTSFARWINPLKWAHCRKPRKLEQLQDKPCYAGLDLSSKIDLASFVMIFPDEEKEDYDVFAWFFLPEKRLEDETDIAKYYRDWSEAGFLTLTEGETVDYEVIEELIIDQSKNFNIKMIGTDPWNARATVNKLDKQKIKIAEVPMNVRHLSEPMKQIQADILKGACRHGKNPVLTWCVLNIICKPDANRNIFPRKESEDQKIDGGIALILARGRMLAEQPKVTEKSVYSRRGMVFL